MKQVRLYAGVGPVLNHYDVDVDGFALTKRGSAQLPGGVQYTWPHASKPFMYAICSDWVSQHDQGAEHYLCALKLDPQAGGLALHGSSIRLHNHPVHLSTDSDSRHLLVACNVDCELHIYRIRDDGGIGERVAQRSGIDWGVFAHQIRISADNRMAILVNRGNPYRGKDAHKERQVDPGALKVFDYNAGMLGEEQSVAPGGGYHFGARHLDFHPRAPWVFVSLETQNKLCVFRREGNRLLPEPLFQRDILANPAHVPTPQIACTLRVHPNGRYVYCVNRGHIPVDYDGKKVLMGADNTFAVFSINEATGEPTLIQRVDSEGVYARTFNIDPSGRMLIACNRESRLIMDGDELRPVFPNLALFEIMSDGTLKFVRKFDVAPEPKGRLWMSSIVEG